MKVLRSFSEKEKNYHLYQSRLDAVRLEKTWETTVKQAVTEKDKAVKKAEKAVEEKDKAVEEKDKAMEENERLKELLKKAGMEPEL